MAIKVKSQITTMKNKGSLVINKGKSSGLALCSFDALTNCTMKDCCIYDSCPYNKDKNKACGIRKQYLSHVLKTLEKVPSTLNELVGLKIGFNLIPLFSQLINMKILAHSLSGNIMRGTQIHPVFREIRQTIKLITDLLKDLEPKDKYENFTGTSSYYDELFTEEKPEAPTHKRKILRANKKNKEMRNLKF